MKIVYSPKCLEYKELIHPDSPQRIENSAIFLKQKGYEFIEPDICSDNDILLAHDKKLVQQVKSSDFFDPDTPIYKNIYYYAKLSASGGIKALNLAINGQNAFSLMRPPGHHAGKSFLGGFCYFNNLAIAIKRVLSIVDKAAILDIDCHHGNGTQDIFLGLSRVLYVSLHQSPFYPGTGLKSEFNAINFPLLANTDEKTYLSKLEIGLKKIKEFNPDVLGISAGFDTYIHDPLTQFGLGIHSYKKIGKMISKLNIPIFCVLEGGYSKDLKKCIYSFLQGF